MRRVILAFVVAVAGLMASATEAAAQFDLSRALNALVEAQAAASTQKSAYDLLAESAPQSSKLTGVWLYQSVSLENLGANPIAELALPQIEGYLAAALRNERVSAGAYGLTVRRNGVVFLSYGDEIIEGKYRYNAEDATVRITATHGKITLDARGYVAIKDGKLIVYLDANELYAALLQVYPEYRNDPTAMSIESTLRGFTGVYIALKHSR